MYTCTDIALFVLFRVSGNVSVCLASLNISLHVGILIIGNQYTGHDDYTRVRVIDRHIIVPCRRVTRLTLGSLRRRPSSCVMEHRLVLIQKQHERVKF